MPIFTKPSTAVKKTPVSSPAVKPRFEYDRAYQSRLIRVLYQEAGFTCTAGIHLSHEHFEKKLHRWLAKTILDYAKKYGSGISIDAIKNQATRDARTGRVQKKELPELTALIKKLDNPVKDKSYVKDDLFLFIKHQAVRDAIMGSLDYLEKQDYEPIDKLFERAIEVKMATTGGVGKFYTKDLAARMKRRRLYVRNGVPTGLALDDHMKPGGLPPKQLGVVIAPPGGGKSSCLVHLGKSAVLESEREGGERVLHVTLELADEVIEDKYDAAFSGVVLSALEDEIAEVEASAAKMGTKYGDFLVVKEFPPASLTVSGLRSYMRQLERLAFYPTMLIVDYADLLLPSRHTSEGTYEEIGSIYQDLRKLAVEMEIPVWTASQANRAALEKPIITIADLAESFKKAMVADVMIALCQTSEEKTHKKARFYVAKNRNGSSDMQFPVRLDWARSSIKNL